MSTNYAPGTVLDTGYMNLNKADRVLAILGLTPPVLLEWMNGWVCGWVGRWMNEWTDKELDRWMGV